MLYLLSEYLLPSAEPTMSNPVAINENALELTTGLVKSNLHEATSFGVRASNLELSTHKNPTSTTKTRLSSSKAILSNVVTIKSIGMQNSPNFTFRCLHSFIITYAGPAGILFDIRVKDTLLF